LLFSRLVLNFSISKKINNEFFVLNFLK